MLAAFAEPHGSIVAFEVGLVPSTGQITTMRSVSTGAILSQTGALFEVDGAVVVDAGGLRPSGGGAGQIRWGGYVRYDLRVQFSPDLVIAESPYRIASGSIAFYEGDTRVAVLSRLGLELLVQDPIGEPVEVALPAQVEAFGGLVTLNLAGTTAHEGPGGTIDVRADAPMTLTVRGISSATQADVTTLLLDPVDLSVRSLAFSSVVSEAQAFGPVVVRSVGASSGALYVEVEHAPFGQPTGVSQRLTLDAAGRAQVRVGQEVEAVVTLVDGSDRARLLLSRVDGTLTFGLDARPEFAYTVDGTLEFGGLVVGRTGAVEQGTAMRVPVQLRYSPSGARLAVGLSDGDQPLGARLALGSLGLRLAARDLALGYTPDADRWTFEAAVDAELSGDLDGGDAWRVPLAGGRLTERGLAFPDARMDDLALDPLSLGPVSLRLDGFRMPQAQFDWFGWEPGDAVGLLPTFDLTLTMPQIADVSPGLAARAFEMTGVGYADGVLTGSLALELDRPAMVSMGRVRMEVERVAAALGTDASGEPSVDVDLRARFAAGLFGDEADACQPTVALGLHLSGEGLMGEVAGFAPCGAVRIGPLALTTATSTLTFGIDDERQPTVVLGGQVTASIPSWNGLTAGEASGAAVVDLVGLRVVSSDLSLGGLAWQYPAADPFYAFDLPTVALSGDALVLRGEGRVQVGDAQADVTFEGVGLDLQTGEWTGGAVRFDGALTLTASAAPLAWRLDQSLALDTTATGPGVALTVPFGSRLSARGLTLNGTASAALRVMQGRVLGVDVALDSLRLASGRIAGGRAEFRAGETQTVLATLDAHGLRLADPGDLTPLALGLLPDVLALGGVDLGELAIKGPGGEPLVQAWRQDDGRYRITARADAQSLFSLAPLLGERALAATLDYLVLDPTTFEVLDGSISAVLDEPLSVGGLPLAITAAGFSLTDGLWADAQHELFGTRLEADATSRLSISPDGVLTASVELASASVDAPLATIPLIGQDDVRLDIPGFSGTIRYDLFDTSIPDFDYSVDALFVVEPTLRGEQPGETAFDPARAVGGLSRPATPGGIRLPLRLSYDAAGAQVDALLGALAQAGRTTMAAGNFRFGMSLDGLGLSYDPVAASGADSDGVTLGGWSFDADLSMDFGVVTPDGASWSVALDRVSLTPDGLVFPDLDLDDLSLPPFALGPVELSLSGFSLPSATFNPFDLDSFSGESSGEEEGGASGVSGLAALLPSFDFALRLPGLEDKAPTLAAQTFTFSDVSFAGGFLSGALDELRLPDMATVSLGSLDLGITHVFGGLSAPSFGSGGGDSDSTSADGSGGFPGLDQLFDIRFKGRLGGSLFSSLASWGGGSDSDTTGGFSLPTFDLPDAPFPDTGYDGGDCSAEVSFGLVGMDGFEGNVTDFAPCGRFYVGVLEAGFTKGSVLDFSVTLDEQKATLRGGVEAGLRARGGFGGATATGTVALDLIAGAVTESDVTFNGLTWQYPALDPFFTFAIPTADLTDQGVVLAGSGTLSLGDGATAQARVDQVRIGFDGSFASGDVRISGDLALRTPLDSLDWRLVPASDSSLTGAQAFLAFDPGTAAVLNRSGFTVDGSGAGGLRLDDGDQASVVLDFESFRIGMDPVGVAGGRASLIARDATIAYFDASGFQMGDASELIAAATSGLPDAIPLGHPRVGRLLLREGGEWLVDVARLPGGGLRLSTPPGRAPRLQITPLPGFDLAATLDGLTLDPTTFLPTDGHVRVSLPDASGLSIGGLPFDLSAFGFNLSSGLYFEGLPTLFDAPADPDAEPSRLTIGDDGTLTARFDVRGLARSLQLVPGSDRLRLDLDGFSGSLSFNLLGGTAPTFDYQIPASFVVGGPSGELLRTGLTLRHGESFTELADVDIQPGSGARASLNVGAFTFDFALADLDLTRQNGAWQFAAGLDFVLAAQTPSGASWSIPLRGVTLRPDGFAFPAQETVSRDAGAPGGWDLPPFRLGPVELNLLAGRLPDPVTFDWFDFSPGDALALIPSFDFELRLPGFADRAPRLAAASFSLSDVSFANGLLTGDLIPFTFDDLPMLELGDGVSLAIGRVFGGLSGGGSGSAGETGASSGSSGGQDFGISFGGALDLSGLFGRGGSSAGDGSDEADGSGGDGGSGVDLPDAGYAAGDCVQNVELGLVGDFGLGGEVTDFAPCGRLFVGPLSVGFDESVLTFAVGTDGQEARLRGQVSAAWAEGAAFSGATATGLLDVDLTSLSIRESGLSFSGVQWNLPAADPLLTLDVPTLALSSDGFTLGGTGRLDLGGGADVTAAFDGVRLGLDGEIETGSVAIGGGFSVGTRLDSLAWSLGSGADRLQADVSDPAMLLSVASEGGVSLTADGLRIDAGGTAGLRINRRVFEANLAMDGFTFGLTPVRIAEGSASLLRASDDALLATVTPDGIELGDLAALIPIPDRIGLPSEATAFLQLRDPATGEMTVELIDQGDTRTLRTLEGQAARLVLASLGTADAPAPQVDVAFSLSVDDAYQIVGGSLAVDLAENPLSLADYGMPLSLTSVAYAQDGGAFDLSASVRLQVGSDTSAFSLDLASTLSFDETGFRDATISGGRFGTTFPADYVAQNAPLARWQVSDAMGLHVYGLDLDFDQNRFRISGSVTSEFFGATPATSPYFTAGYDGAQWRFTASDAHLPGGLPLGSTGRIDLDDRDGMSLALSDDAFALDLAGILELPDLGDGVRLSVDEFHLGSDGARVDASFSEDSPQQIALFNRAVVLTLTEGRLEVDGFDLALTSSGVLTTSFATRPAGDLSTARSANSGGALATTCALTGSASSTQAARFSDLRIGTDGSFALGEGKVNLLAGLGPVQIVPGMVCVNALEIETVASPGGTGALSGGANDLQLTLGVVAEVPNLRDPCRRNPGSPGCSAGTSTESTLALGGQIVVSSDGSYDGELFGIFDSSAPSGALAGAPMGSGTYQPLLNGSVAELEVGGKAVFELTGMRVDLDLYDPYNTEIALSAALHLITGKAQAKPAKGRTVRNARARRDHQGRTYKTLAYGNPYALQDPAQKAVRFTLPRPPSGLSVDAPDFSVPGVGLPDFVLPDVSFNLDLSLPGLPNLSLPGARLPSMPELLVDFEIGQFSMGLYSIDFNPDLFAFNLSGIAGLSMPTLDGYFGFRDLEIGFAPLTFSFGEFLSPFAFNLNDVIGFEVGCLDTFERAGEGDAMGAIQRGSETLSDLNRYVRLAPATACGGTSTRGASVSIGKAFSGSVDEVLYYEQSADGSMRTGETGVLVENAQIALMKDVARLQATFEYVAGGDDFEIGVSGAAQLKSGPTWTEFVATGNLGVRGGEPTFGVFLAKSGGAPVPIVPGIVDLMGVGGGFFYRPQSRHLQRVYDALGDDVRVNNPNGLPRADDLAFAILLYADVGVGGSGGAYAVRGNGLVAITDAFFNVDLNGYVMPRPPDQASELRGGAYLTMLYGGGGQTLQGGINVDVNYIGPAPLLATREGDPIRMDFAYSKPDSGPETWFVDGRGSVEVMRLVSLDGAILASDDGFLAQVSASASLNAGVIEAKGRIGLDFWYNTAREEVGAYAEIRAEASVLGGLAEVGANMRGALIASGDSYLLYAGASARVKVLFVFDGSIDLWMALENGRTRGGTGRNARYEAIVADSRALLGKTRENAAQAQQATAAALAAAQNPDPPSDPNTAQGDATRFVSTAAEIETAAEVLARDPSARKRVGRLIERLPSDLGANRNWGEWVREQLYNSDPPSLGPPTSTAWMDRVLGEIDDGRDDYDATVADLKLLLGRVEAMAEATAVDGSPVSRVGGQRGFTLDESLGDAQQQAMADYQADVAQVAVSYAERLAEMEASLVEVGALLDGARGAARYVDLYNDAALSLSQTTWLEDVRSGIYLTDLAEWRSSRLQIADDARLGVRSSILTFLSGRFGRTNGAPDCCELDDASELVTSDGTRITDVVAFGDRHPPAQRDAWGTTTAPNSTLRDARQNGATRARLVTTPAALHRAIIRDLAGGDGAPQYADQTWDLRCAIETEIGLWGRDATTCPGENNAQMGTRFRPNAVTYDFLGVRALLYEETYALYHTLPRRMADRMGELGASLASDVSGFYSDNLSALAGPHATLSLTVDSLYARRAELSEKLAGMYDQYAVYLSEQGEAAAADRMIARRQNLLITLRPPKLTDWTVETTPTAQGTPGAEGARIGVSWETQEDAGAVLAVAQDGETAWNGLVRPYTQNTWRNDWFLQGQVEESEYSFEYYALPADSADTEAQIDLSLRLRSKAGALFSARTRTLTVPLTPRGNVAAAQAVVGGCPSGATCGNLDISSDPDGPSENISIPYVAAPLGRSGGSAWTTTWTRVPVEVGVTNPSGRALDLSYQWHSKYYERRGLGQDHYGHDTARPFLPQSLERRGDRTIARGDLPIPSTFPESDRMGGLQVVFAVEGENGTRDFRWGPIYRLDARPPTLESTRTGWSVWWQRTGPPLASSRPAGQPAGDRASAFGSGERVVIERTGALVDDSVDGVSGPDSLFAWMTATPDRPIGKTPSAGFASTGGTSAPIDVPNGRAYLYVAGTDVAGNVQYADAVVARSFGLPVAPQVALEPAAGGAVVSITQPDDGWRVAGYQIACKSALGGTLTGSDTEEAWAFGGAGEITHRLADSLPGRRAEGALAFSVSGWPCALYVRPVYDAPGGDPTVFAHRTVLADATPPDLTVARVAAGFDGQTRLSVQASDAESGLKSLRYRTRSRSGGALSAWANVPGFRSDGDSRRSDSLVIALDSNPTEIAVEAVSWGGTRSQRVVETSDASAPLFRARVAPLTGAGTGVRIAVDGLTDPQTGVDRLEYRFRLDGQDMMWSNWASVPLPVADGAASVSAAFEVQWPETDRIDQLSVRVANGDGLARDTTLDLRLLDFSLPLYTIDRLRVTRGRAELEVFLRDARDPESGLTGVDVRTRSEGRSAFGAWQTVQLDEPLRQQADVSVTVPVGGAQMAQVRMRNGFDLVTNPVDIDLTSTLHDRVAPPEPSVMLRYSKSNAQSVSSYPLALSGCSDAESGGAKARARLFEGERALPWQPVTCSDQESTTNFSVATTTPITTVEVEVTDAAGNTGTSTHALSAVGTPRVFARRREIGLAFDGKLLISVDEGDAPVHRVEVRGRVCGQPMTGWVSADYTSSSWFGRLLFQAALPALDAQRDFSDLASLSARIHSATGTTVQDVVEPLDCAPASSVDADAP